MKHLHSYHNPNAGISIMEVELVFIVFINQSSQGKWSVNVAVNLIVRVLCHNESQGQV